MRFLCFLWLMALLTGCSLVSTSLTPSVAVLRPQDRLTLGMAQAQAQALMNAKVVSGYQIDPVTGVSRPIEIRNLYSSELVDIRGVLYQVDSYMVRPFEGGRISGAELFPVVYKDGLLVAKGHDGLAGLRAQP